MAALLIMYISVGFSVIAVMKRKYSVKIDMEWETRVVVSDQIPRFKKLCGAQQAPDF